MGGKKKKSNNGPPKKESKYKIPARFDCPVCDAKASIVVTLKRRIGEATVVCRRCREGEGQNWALNPLQEKVDIFFKFREALVQRDRDYMREQQIEKARETGVTDIAGSADKRRATNLTNNSNLQGSLGFLVAVGSGGNHAAASSSQRGAAASADTNFAVEDTDYQNMFEGL